MILTPPPMREFFSGVMSRPYLGPCVPNFKFTSLTILELLAFKTQKISVTWPWRLPFFANFFRGLVVTLPLSVRAKFKVRIFSHFRAVSIQRPKMYGVTWPWPRPFLHLFDIQGLAAPRDVVWTMNRYNWSTHNAREVFQYSHWKALCSCQFEVKWGKNRGYP